MNGVRSKCCTVTFITGHYYPSLRRAGFHNLADAAHRQGWRVNFITVGYSLLSYLRRDYRTKMPGIRANCNQPVEIRPGSVSYVHFTPWHPHTLVLPGLDRLTRPFMEQYGEGDLGRLLPLVKETDVFVFESMSGLFLFRRFRRENPAARVIYRVSDDVRILGSTHPRLVELEREIAPDFDSVSVPSSWMLDLFPGLPTLRLHRHGLDTQAYDACSVPPYRTENNAVFVGTGYLDVDFLHNAVLANQDVNFHIIGPIPRPFFAKNLFFYREMPFSATIPYIKFADIGLGTRTFRGGCSASLTDSLKIQQYRYCGLPIISPDFIQLQREGVFYYTPGDIPSITRAVRDALAHGKAPAFAGEVRSWDEVFHDMFSDVQEAAA